MKIDANTLGEGVVFCLYLRGDHTFRGENSLINFRCPLAASKNCRYLRGFITSGILRKITVCVILSLQEQVTRQCYNEKSDIWSLGCLMYELCALSPPFTATNQKALEAKIRIGKFRPIPSRYSQDLSDLVSSMMQVRVSCLRVKYILK